MNDLALYALKAAALIASCGLLAVLFSLSQPDNPSPPHHDVS